MNYFSDRMDQICNICGSNVGFDDGDDGYFYCGNCNSQAEGIFDERIDEHDFFKRSSVYSQRRARPTPLSKSQPWPDRYLQRSISISKEVKFDDGKSQPWPDRYLQRSISISKEVKFDDGVGPSGPSDFGSGSRSGGYESYYLAIRKMYVLGFQMMLQIQTKALVEYFGVSSNIVDLHNPILSRLLARVGVIEDDWADKVLQESEINKQGEVSESQRFGRHTAEPQNMFGQRAVMIWLKSLHSCLPISYTLALSFLFCHVAEEPILPTDILKGVLEGKIPYFSAFLDIEKQLGPPIPSCPISYDGMFRPVNIVSLQKLEATAVCIAQKIGLELRPLYFNALATRYIKEIGLPVSKILPRASYIYELCVPHGIYLSVNEFKLPSRVCLMSILVVAIRLCYNINGSGKWESTMSNSNNSFPRGNLKSDNGSDALEEDFVPDISSKDSDIVELLRMLDDNFEKLCELHDTFGQYKDLPSYVQFCNDSVFAGIEPSLENFEEGEMVNDLIEFYQQHQKDFEVSEKGKIRPREDQVCTPIHNKNDQGDGTACDEDRAIKSMKRDMEDNKFVYIQPRNNIKKDDHIYYSRTKRNGAYIYAAHSDYYILLRSCAKVCQVDMRTMHSQVLSIERRLHKREGEHVDSTV